MSLAAPVQAALVESVGLQPPLDVAQIAGGLSNVTSIVTDARERRVVVRRPPDGKHEGGAHDVLREARIMAALANSDVPVPAVLWLSKAADGQPWPWYAMDHVDGVVVDSLEIMGGLTEPARHRLGLDLVGVLAALQRVDLDGSGLAELRRSTPYAQRQLRRWRARWAETASRSLPLVDRVADRLERELAAVTPREERLVHGDFRLGNVIVTRGPEPRIAALLDWELATTGHPLADLGFLGARMHAPAAVLADGADPASAPGAPSFEELARHFSSVTGVPVTELPVFVALSAWRWAIIAEGIAQRFSGNQMGSVQADVEWQRSRVEVLAQLAWDWLES